MNREQRYLLLKERKRIRAICDMLIGCPVCDYSHAVARQIGWSHSCSELAMPSICGKKTESRCSRFQELSSEFDQQLFQLLQEINEELDED